MDINKAIKVAISESPELSKLLKASDVTGSEQLKIDAQIAGLNDLRVDVVQKEVLENTSSAGYVAGTHLVLSSYDTSAVAKGILATTTDYFFVV